jgi:leader peptidase (prepilin peptidase)/N-methyltransferase
LLKGRCRSCGLPISLQYPIVEIITAALFGVTAAHFGLSWNLAIFIVFFGGMIPLMAIDLIKQLLPVKILYPVLAIDAAILLSDAIVHHTYRELLYALAAAAVWFIVFFLINLARPHALGFGDVRLVALIGLCLGWLGIPIVFVGFFAADVLGLGVGLGLIAAGLATRKTPIPLGLFLGVGAIFAVFAGPPVVSHLQGLR